MIEYINDMHALFWTLNLASDSLAVWKYIILFGYNFPIFSVLPMSKEPIDKYYTEKQSITVAIYVALSS